MFHVSRRFKVSPNGQLRKHLGCKHQHWEGRAVCRYRMQHDLILQPTSPIYPFFHPPHPLSRLPYWSGIPARHCQQQCYVKPSLFTTENGISCTVTPPFQDEFLQNSWIFWFFPNFISMETSCSCQGNPQVIILKSERFKVGGVVEESVLVSHRLQFLIQGSFQSAIHNDLKAAVVGGGGFRKPDCWSGRIFGG